MPFNMCILHVPDLARKIEEVHCEFASAGNLGSEIGLFPAGV